MKSRISALTIFIVVLIFTLSPAQEIEYVTSIMWSDVQDVHVVVDIAYCALKNGLVILDISDPESPILMSQLYLGGGARRIHVVASIAYIADGHKGLQMINIENPYSPEVIYNYDTPDTVKDIHVVNNYVFILDRPYGFHILDVSDPYNPIFVSSYETPGQPNAIFVLEDYAYIADPPTGLYIVNISDPQNPHYTGQYYTGEYEQDIFVENNFAYLAEIEYGIKIIDVSDPENPTLASNYHEYGDPYKVTISQNYAYVAADYHKLYVLDVNDPFNPEFVSRYQPEGNAVSVFKSGDYIFVAESFTGLSIADATDPYNIFFIGRYSTPQPVYYLFAADNLLFRPRPYDPWGLYFIDTSNPYNPSIIDIFFEDEEINDIYVREEYAFIAFKQDDLRIYNISEPENPTLISTYGTHAVHAKARGTHLYICNRSGRFEIASIYNVYEPEFRGQVELDCSAKDFCLSGNYAIIAAGYRNGFIIVFFANPYDPIVITRYPIQDVTEAVTVRDHYLYLVCRSSGLMIFDLSDIYNPELVSTCNTPWSANSVSLYEDYAYVGDYEGGIQVIDISEPTTPYTVGSFRTPYRTYDMVMADDIIYVADISSIMILKPSSTIIEDEPPKPLLKDILTDNYPNPFNTTTTIRYTFPYSSQVRLEVFNISGQRVEKLVDSKQQPGEHSVIWDGTDSEGNPLSSGIYFYSLSCGEECITKRMVLLK